MRGRRRAASATSTPRRRRSNCPSTVWPRRSRPRPLQVAAEEAALRGASAGSTADKYLLAVVLDAASLFQLGIQGRIVVFELRRALVIVSAGIIVGTTLSAATLPTTWRG